MFLSLTRKRFRVNDMLGVYCEIRFITVLEMIGEIRVWGVMRHCFECQLIFYLNGITLNNHLQNSRKNDKISKKQAGVGKVYFIT